MKNNNGSSKRILLTGCGGPLGVNVTRSLKMAPEDITVVGTDCNSYHTYLSLADETHLIPPAKQEAEYLTALKQLIADNNIDMILPTHPVEVRTISKNRDLFKHVRFCLPDHEVIVAAQDKWQTHQHLREGGVPVPKTLFLNTPEDVKQAFKELGDPPLWVRGSGVPGAGIGLAALPCRQPEHAIAWIDHWRGFGYFMASEFLPGRNVTWCGIFNQGSLVASQGRERLEYVLPHVSPSGITGAPAVSKTVHRDDINSIGEKAVRLLADNPHGVFFVDFKEDNKSQPRVTEINGGRFGTTIHFYSEAGFNFPYLLVRIAFEESLEDGPWIDPIPEETFWIRTLDCGPVLLQPDGSYAFK